MIRSLMLKELTRSYGHPTTSQSQDWWTVNVKDHLPVHICLNHKQGSQAEAHLMVFNPGRVDGQTVTEMRPTTLEQATDALKTLRNILAEAESS